MATGIEMLVNTLMKYIGVDPETIKQQGAEFVNDISAKVNNFDERLQRLETQNMAIIAALNPKPELENENEFS